MAEEKEKTATLDIWSQRDLGVDLTQTQALGEVGEKDCEYLCDHVYPFLQFINANASFTEEFPIKFISASSGLVIHDYGEAISVSIPQPLASKADSKSYINFADQAKTVEEIAELIADKGWTVIELIAGTSMMKRFLWIESQRVKFTLNGYTPTDDDEKCCEHLAKRAQDMGLIWEHAVIKKLAPDMISTAG